MLVGAEYLLVLDYCLGGLAIVDLRQQAAPGTNGRLQHHGIADFLDGRQGAFRSKGDRRARRRDLRLGQGCSGQNLVPAHIHHMGPIDGLQTPGLQNTQAGQRPAVGQASFQHDIEPVPFGPVPVLAAGNVKGQG